MTRRQTPKAKSPSGRLGLEEERAARKAEAFFARAFRIYSFFFFRLSNYGAAVRAWTVQAMVLEPGERVLDAGCGTGLLTRALYSQSEAAGRLPITFHAFDLTAEMIGELEAWIGERQGIETALFNVLEPEARPRGWGDYDKVVTSAMMEYLPRASLAPALRGLGALMKKDGTLTLMITRRNVITSFVVGTLWRSNLWRRKDLVEVIRQAGFTRFTFHDFPAPYKSLGASMIIVEMGYQE